MNTNHNNPAVPSLDPVASGGRSSRPGSRRLPGRLLLGAATLSLAAGALGGVAHAGDKSDRSITCDRACVLAFSDTDGDGYSDAYELVAGTNPFDAASHPSEKATSRLIDEGQLARVSVTVDGPVLITAAPGFIYDVDLSNQPDGSSAVTSTLVDPLTGAALTANHYGIDAVGTGIDLKGLADAAHNDPGSLVTPGAATPSLPSEKPELNGRDNKSLYSDDEGDSEDPPAADPPAADPPADDPPAADPGDDGGGDSGGDVAGGPKMNKMCNMGDPCGPDDKAAPEPKAPGPPKGDEKPKTEEKSLWERFKCGINPFCAGLSDPDAAPTTVDTSNPPTKVLIAPADPVRDGQPEIQAPSGAPQTPANDPTVTDPNPDAEPTAVAPGTPPKVNIAPVDPVKPGTEGGNGPVLGRAIPH